MVSTLRFALGSTSRDGERTVLAFVATGRRSR
jgi:hypothetical protein